MRPPQQGHELVAALGLGGGAGQEGEQTRQLLAVQINGTIGPGQFEAAEQRKLKCGRRHSVLPACQG
jgi:hypothetical protein